mmetsp:Transcript_1162/g.2344  ORF Transcript_1162/g.2344 Transcript_1162/m.2344 type:complete len:540 (-) Transcript_1162:96-1715(-)
MRVKGKSGKATTAKRKVPGAKKVSSAKEGAAKAADASQVSTAELESIVFGGADFLQRRDETEEDEEGPDEEEPDSDDLENTDILSVSKPKKRVAKQEAEQADDTTARAAWTDPDDASLQVELAGGKQKRRRGAKADKKVAGDEYERHLRHQFVKLNGSASWADDATAPVQDETSDSEDEDLPKAASSVRQLASSSQGGFLKPGELDVAKLKELPIAAGLKKGPACIEALQFHPSSELLLTAGRDKTLRLFAADGEENPKVASYHFKQFPILGASFTPSGEEVLMTSSSSQMWGLDVRSGETFEVRNVSAEGRMAFRSLAMGPAPSVASGLQSSKMFAVLGDGGSVFLNDLKTKHTIRTMRMSAPGVACVFSLDRDCLYSADEDCNIYEWDLSSGRCRQRVKEAWAMKIQCLAIRGVTDRSPTPMLAVGTSTGNVDLMDLSGPKILAKPSQTIGNLTTRIDALRFNPDGQILGCSSRMKVHGLKVVHAGTATAFANWPTQKTPIKRASAIDFSRLGGLMAIGNESGRVLLYRLRHYNRAS